MRAGGKEIFGFCMWCVTMESWKCPWGLCIEGMKGDVLLSFCNFVLQILQAMMAKTETKKKKKKDTKKEKQNIFVI